MVSETTQTAAPGTPGRTYNSVDVAKICAAVMVAAIHSQPLEGLAKDIVIDVFARVAVPFFFMASAFFFFRRPCTGRRLAGFVRRLGLLYLFWFVAELPITVYNVFIHSGRPVGESLLVLLRGFVFGSTFSGSWFLMALIEGVPLVWLASRFLRPAALLAAGVALYAVAVAFSYYHAFLPPGLMAAADAYKAAIGGIQNSWVVAFLFCAAGKVVAEREDAIRRLPRRAVTASLAVTCALSAAEVLAVKSVRDPDSTDIFFVLPLFALSFFLFVLTHEARGSADYVRMRNYSTVFYLSHFVFVYIFVVINKHIAPVDPVLKYAAVLLLCTATARALTTLSARRGLGWLRYGY